MAKRTTPLELTLGEKPQQISLTRWLHEQLLRASQARRVPFRSAQSQHRSYGLKAVCGVWPAAP